MTALLAVIATASRKMLLLAVCVSLPPTVQAQPLRRYDAIELTDQIRCAGGPTGVAGLVPGTPSLVASASGAVTSAYTRRRRGPDSRAPSMLLQSRVRAGSSESVCGGLGLTVEGTIADGGQAGVLAQVFVPVVTPTERSPTNESRGQIGLYAGGSLAAKARYDPFLPLSDEIWLGLSIRPPDLRTEIPIPTKGWGIVRLRFIVSIQADLTRSDSTGQRSDSRTIPHLGLFVPLSPFRSVGSGSINGLAFVYERVGPGADGSLITRQSGMISIFRNDRFPIRLGLRLGKERRGTARAYWESALVLHTRARTIAGPP